MTTMPTNPSRPGRTGLVRVHAWLVVVATLVTVGSAAAFALTRPTSYVATAQVALGPEIAGGAALRPEMASEREIATSGTVINRTADRLGLEAKEAAAGLSVSVVIESSVLNIRYTAASAETASARATAFAQSYVDYRNSSSRIARVVTWPDVAERNGPNLPLILGIALLAGVALGVGAAWLWDRLSDRIHGAEELADRTDLPVLAEVPRWRTPGAVAPEGPIEESFAYVAAQISSSVAHRRGVTLMVTSPRSGAGTTTIALNTALAFAAQERDVILVGADVHDPRLHEILEMPRAPGLVEVLHAECDLESAIRKTRWPNLSALALGGSTAARHTSLQPDMLALVLGQLGSRAIVVIDAPPVLESAASLELADQADVVLLVGDLRSGRRGDVDHAVHLLEGVHPVITGWIANRPSRPAPPGREGQALELKSFGRQAPPQGDRSQRAAS